MLTQRTKTVLWVLGFPIYVGIFPIGIFLLGMLTQKTLSRKREGKEHLPISKNVEDLSIIEQV